MQEIKDLLSLSAPKHRKRSTVNRTAKTTSVTYNVSNHLTIAFLAQTLMFTILGFCAIFYKVNTEPIQPTITQTVKEITEHIRQ